MRKQLRLILFGISLMGFFSVGAQCPPAAPLTTPYFEDFESESNITSSGTNTLANCWIAGATPTHAAQNWRVDNGGTTSSLTGPSLDNTLKTSAGKYVYFEGTGTQNNAGDRAYFTSPDIDVSNLTSPELTFYYHRYGQSMSDLLVDVYNGSTWDSALFSISGQQHSSTTAPYNKAIVNLAAYTNDTIKIRFVAVKSTDYYTDMAIDDISIHEAPLCPQPTALTASNVQAYQATLSWTAVGAASSYSIIYGTSGFNPASGGTTTTSNVDSVTVTNLMAATAYDFYVVAGCGVNGSSDTSGPQTFTTACAPFATPIVENFDGIPVGSTSNPALPNCWSYYRSATNMYAYTRSTTLSKSPTNSLYWYRSSGAPNGGDTLLVTMPEIQGLVNNNKQLEFYMRSNTASNTVNIVVGSITDPADPSTFSPIDTFITNSVSYPKFKMYFDAASGYNGTDNYIAFASLYRNTSATQYIYIDDISVTDAPPCPDPVGLDAKDVTANSATLTWNSITAASSYTVIYGPNGFDPATGGTTVNSTVDTLAITGLSPAVYYDFYVISNCGAGVMSDTSTVKTFASGCGAVITPYTQNFELTTPGNSSTPTLPLCWTYYRDASSSYAYTLNSTTYSRSLPHSLYFYRSSSSGAVDDSVIVSTAEVRGLDSNTKQMEFYVRGRTNNPSYIIVGTITDPNDDSTFTPMDTFLIHTDTYEKQLVHFDTNVRYNGTDKYIAFASLIPGNVTQYVYIDDITISDMPPCPEPANVKAGYITNNMAEIKWSSGGSAFKLEYGPTGYTQGTGFVSFSNETVDTLTGLAGNTCYDVYIQNDCSPQNGLSSWSGPYTFCTDCDAQATPILENFDNTNTGNTSNASPPQCWSYLRSSTGYGYTRNLSSRAYSPTKFWYMFNPSSAAPASHILVSPAIAGITTNEAQVTFWARNYYSNDNGKLIIGTLSDPSDINSFKSIDTISITSTTYNYFSVIVDAANGYNGTDQYIGFAMTSNTSTEYLCIDDIQIQDKPDCFPSDNLMATNVLQNTATVSWTPGDGSKFQIEVGETSFVQGTGAFVTTTDSFANVTGLLSNTCYDVYVRDSCSSSQTWSPWFGPYTFCTLCDETQTVMEDFESAASGSSTNPSPPDCWTYMESPSNNAAYGYTRDWAARAQSGSQFFYYYRSSSILSKNDSVFLISPGIEELDSNDMQISFSARTSSTSGRSLLAVGTVTDPSDMSSFTALETVNITGSTYSDYRVRINSSLGYNGTDKFIALAHLEANGTTQYIYLDDVIIDYVPACDAPFNVNVSNITTTGADVSWGSVRGNCFKLEYGPTGFIQGSGNGTVIQNATSPQSLTGLMPGTDYDVYIADCCDTTLWSNVVTFTTPCANQLSGTYTVGGAPGPNNFPTIDSAVNVLNSCGVSGPVTLNLSGGTHNAFTLGEIYGTSATNMITINGSAQGDTILADTNDRAAIQLNGADYITLDNLTIINTIDRYVIWMHNDASHIDITNNTVIGDQASTSSIYAAIVATGSGTSASSQGENVSYLNISNNSISGGYYGISLYGATYQLGEMITIANNTIEDVYYYGLRLFYMEGVTVNQNTVDNYRGTTNTIGFYFNYCDELTLTRNETYASREAYYCRYLNIAGGANAQTSVIANNIGASEIDYAIDLYGSNNVEVYHNTMGSGSSYGFYLGGPNTETIDIRNNIFVSVSNYAFYNTANIANLTLDNNLYHTYSGSNLAYNGTAYQDLAAWRAVDSTLNVNSLEGDPVFNAVDDLRLYISPLADQAGDNSVGITVDIDGDARPSTGTTIVDIGADEYEPIASDLSLFNGYLTRGECLSTNDTVVLEVHNIAGSTLDMSVTNVVASWTVTGPVNSSGTITVNTGTLAFNDTLTMMAMSADLSVPGNYTLNAHLLPSSYNLAATNDTLEPSALTVGEVWKVTPTSDTIVTLVDSATLKAESPYFGGGGFHVTEVMHFKTGTGSPTGGWPSWHNADEHIEISGVPGSDLGGITFEQWNTSGTSPTGSYTFPAGSYLSPDGTAIVAMRAVNDSPSDFYYDGSGGNTVDWQSGSGQGIILKDASGTIIDAVGYPSSSGVYTFPASAGVTSADWTNLGMSSAGSTCGIRLNGPDLNNSTGWSTSSNTNRQDPNVVNANVVIPLPTSITGFGWYLNGTLVDTMPEITVAHYTNGVYNYVATYYHKCDTFIDTVPVYTILPPCTAPTSFTATATSTSFIVLAWNSDAGTTSSYIEYGPTGFTLGQGTVRTNVTSPDTVHGLMAGTTYDFYLVDSCASGATTPVMVTATTAIAVCTPPTGFAVTASGCDYIVVDWSSDAGTISSEIEYGPSGFIPGQGTVKMNVTSPDTIKGLMHGTAYDFYLVDSCSTGTTVPMMTSGTTLSDPVTAAFTWNQTNTSSTDATVEFDASGTVGNAVTYTWDFGNGDTGSGVTDSSVYTANGKYYVTLIVTSNCTSDTISDSITVAGISVDETLIDQSINIYPNPTSGLFRVEFQLEGLQDVQVRVLDAVGKEVYFEDAGNISGIYRQSIDISGNAKGVYIVQVISNRGTTNRRITLH